jgi:hypothetical protein
MPMRMSESPTTAVIKDGNKGSLSWMDALVEAAATASIENEKNKRKQKLKINKKRKGIAASLSSSSSNKSNKRPTKKKRKNIKNLTPEVVNPIVQSNKNLYASARTKFEKIKASQAQQKLRDKEKNKLSRLKAGIDILLDFGRNDKDVLGRLTKLELYIAAIGFAKKDEKDDIIRSILAMREKKHSRNDDASQTVGDGITGKKSDRFKRLRHLEKSYFTELKDLILMMTSHEKKNKKANKYMVLDMVVAFIEAEAHAFKRTNATTISNTMYLLAFLFFFSCDVIIKMRSFNSVK